MVKHTTDLPYAKSRPEAAFVVLQEPRSEDRAATDRPVQAGRSGKLFLDARRLATALTQVVQLGATDVAATLDFYP